MTPNVAFPEQRGLPTNPAAERPGRGASWSEPPGGLLVWLIVGLEVLTFGLGLAVFVVMRGREPEVFRQGQQGLRQPVAWANTVVLLTGGWLMAEAVRRVRAGFGKAAAAWVAGAMGTGVLFLALKSVEYADKLRHGYDLHRDTFSMLYWLLTGFHFVHVVVAVVLLAVVGRGIRTGRYTAGNAEDVEGAGVFWHMCDLVWLLILPVVYLVR